MWEKDKEELEVMYALMAHPRPFVALDPIPWFLTAPITYPRRRTMKEILKDARQTKLRRRVKDDLSDPMTTSTKVSTRYKEDVEYLKDHFNEYEIEVKETACGWSVQVTHQMKTPLEKKCEELTKRLNGRRVHITNVVVAPRIVDERIGIKFDGLPGFPTRTGAISRSYFDAHTVEELAAAIEGLYFA